MEINGEYLKRIYTDPFNTAAFTGPDKLKRGIDREGKRKISKREILAFLQKQDTYTVNRPLMHKFKRNYVVTRGINDQLDIDLADMSRLAKYNDTVTFLLTEIDVFSRVAMVRPLKNKRVETVLTAFKYMLSQKTLRVVRSDFGVEFKNENLRRI